MRRSGLAVATAALISLAAFSAAVLAQGGPPSDAQVRDAFGKEGMRISLAEAARVRDDVRIALREAAAHGIGDSKVDFAAVQIATDLGLDTSAGSATVRNVVSALKRLKDAGATGAPPQVTPPPSPPPVVEWNRYFDQTVELWRDPSFLGLVGGRGFQPVKISWEDIGRYENSVWGDRISDVGIWVRKDEADPSSARLALSVRRDSNFRDKVLMVPAERIKVHQRVGGRTIEKTLPERLRELGLASPARDRNVIVSNQFAIVPVPARSMHGAWPDGVPPRAAFTFSIFPYGSTNFVITDVIEGSHDAIVGPGQHQLLFANVDGQRAPFTASRAEDRQDLLKLEHDLKAQGMDVDVQRYYLIQVPLRRDAAGVQLSNMGTPPWSAVPSFSLGTGAPAEMADLAAAAPAGAQPAAPPATIVAQEAQKMKRAEEPGLSRVAIGHGFAEGPYGTGAGWQGARAEEPIRVTVVYFVTPVSQVSEKDMKAFAAAFQQWDTQAIWGGSFVVK